MGAAGSRAKPAPLAPAADAGKFLESSPLVTGPPDAGALDAGGEVPLFTYKTFGALLVMGLSWVQRGATFTLSYVYVQSYLNAPANVVAASNSIIPAFQIFILIPGVLSDCVPLFGSRRKVYSFFGATIILLAYLILAFSSVPAPYYCEDSTSDPRTVCNEDAPGEAGYAIGMLAFAQVGAVFLDQSLGGLIVDYARREPLPTRGRTFSINAIFCLVGSASGALYVGLAMNTPAYGGSFGNGIGFRGVCGTFAVLQVAILLLLAFNTYEPPLPPSAEGSRIATAAASLQQTADALKSSFVVRIVTYHFLAELVSHVTPPSEQPALRTWCNVTPIAFSLMTFTGCAAFALIVACVMDKLPNWSWRRTVLATDLTSVTITFISGAFVAMNVIRQPWFALGSAFLGSPVAGVTTLTRQLVANFVVTELTGGSNQATISAVFQTVHSMGPPVARALAEPIYGAFSPSMAAQASYTSDDKDFRYVVLIGTAIGAAFGGTIVLFIWLLPDSKLATHAGMRLSVRRPWIFHALVATLAVLIAFALLMTFAPLWPDLACERFFGGAGCEGGQ